jgi:hypothetical protein
MPTGVDYKSVPAETVATAVDKLIDSEDDDKEIEISG